jgi:hypothetical protein
MPHDLAHGAQHQFIVHKGSSANDTIVAWLVLVSLNWPTILVVCSSGNASSHLPQPSQPELAVFVSDAQ